MNRTTLFAAATLATFVSGQALADTTYYGTEANQTVSKQQDNADAAALSQTRVVTVDGQTFAAEQTFGAPSTARAASEPVEANSDAYLGTAWRYQETADAVTR